MIIWITRLMLVITSLRLDRQRGFRRFGRSIGRGSDGGRWVNGMDFYGVCVFAQAFLFVYNDSLHVIVHSVDDIGNFAF